MAVHLSHHQASLSHYFSWVMRNFIPTHCLSSCLAQPPGRLHFYNDFWTSSCSYVCVLFLTCYFALFVFWTISTNVTYTFTCFLDVFWCLMCFWTVVSICSTRIMYVLVILVYFVIVNVLQCYCIKLWARIILWCITVVLEGSDALFDSQGGWCITST